MGLIVETRDFEFHKDEVLWKSTASGHNAGDVRTPAKDFDGFRVIAHHPQYRFGFDAIWGDGFENVHVYDPVGTFRELRYDYSYGAKEADFYGYGRAHADKLTARRDAEYNDGEQVLIKDWYIKAANEFYAWIDEWLKTLTIDHTPLSPKPRAPKKTKAEVAEEREAELLAGGEWSA